jgi:eukaryotic-like serine/threonine-protein kinase
MAFELGQKVGEYELLDVLERSKSGVSYRVRNVLAQRFETLKLLPKSMQEDNDKVERFVREIKVHARLSHPNVVTFYNATVLEGQLVMTTELVEGSTLADVLEAGPVPLPQAVSYVSQVLSALSYAHQHGVVHREITPEHIIVTPDGAVKLGGFGLAKGANDPQLTQAGAVLGSLRYISPEQVKGSTSLDGRADLYSLGVVLYQMVTGRLPFESKSQFDVMLAHVNQAPQPPLQLAPDLPPALNEIILKALAKDPAERFASAEEFQAALAALHLIPIPKQESLTATAAPPAAAPGPTAALPPLSGVTRDGARASHRWQPTELIAAGIFMFIVVTVVVFVLMTLGRR